MLMTHVKRLQRSYSLIRMHIFANVCVPVCKISITSLIHSEHLCSADWPIVSSSLSGGKKQTILRTQGANLSNTKSNYGRTSGMWSALLSLGIRFLCVDLVHFIQWASRSGFTVLWKKLLHTRRSQTTAQLLVWLTKGLKDQFDNVWYNGDTKYKPKVSVFMGKYKE